MRKKLPGQQSCPRRIIVMLHGFWAGLYTPINIYALLENVYRRRHYGAIDKDAQNAHNRRLAHMFAGFSAVAVRAESPFVRAFLCCMRLNIGYACVSRGD